MPYEIKPLGCDPQKVKGMSERLIVCHCQSASKKDPLSACKRDPFVEQRDGYDGRAVRAGCGVGRA